MAQIDIKFYYVDIQPQNPVSALFRSYMKQTRFLIDTYISDNEAFHFAQKSLPKKYPARAHDHDFYEVFLIESGGATHWVNSVEQTVTAGQLVFVRPQDVHAFCANRKSGCQIINIMFRAETAQHLAARYSDVIRGRFFDAAGPLPELQTLASSRFAGVVSAARSLQTGLRSLIRIEEFLLFLVNRVAKVPNNLVPDTPSWFAEACTAALSPDVFRKGSAGFVDSARRSREHVCRTCKSVTGLTPSEYVNRIRIDHAAQLLRSTEAPVNDIIEDCGFENPSYFYRLFLKQIGITPRAYRVAYEKDPFQQSQPSVSQV